MRLLLLTSCLVLAACGGAPRSTPEVKLGVAAEFVAVYNTWDATRAAALFASNPSKRATKLQKHFAWLEDQLGVCGAPQYMYSTSNRGARYTFACERGSLEAWIKLDKAGKIFKMSSGATAVAAPPDLQEAASTVVASLPLSAKARPKFQTNLTAGWAHELGACTLGRPWVFGQHTGLFHVVCEGGKRAVLGVRVDKDGKLLRAKLVKGEQYSYRDPQV